MTEADEPRFYAVLTGLSEIFGKPLNDAALDLWWNALRNMDLDTFNAAANKVAASSKFMPRPADFIEAAHGTPDDRASQAFDVARQAVADLGAYGTVQFTDPAIYATIKALGGWQQFCSTTQDEQWLRKEWIGIYTGYDRLRDALQPPRPFRGLLDQGNNSVAVIGTKGDKQLIEFTEDEPKQIETLQQLSEAHVLELRNVLHGGES